MQNNTTNQFDFKENEIVLYQPNDAVHLEVRMADETVWLSRIQMAELFDRDIKTIGKHIANARHEELKGQVVVAKFATTTQHGAIQGKTQTHLTEYYNLDVIISVGYRVKSNRGVEFRKWATSVLKDYLLKGYSINQRIERLENRVSKTEEKIDFFVRTSLPPAEGIFFNGQIFDAYTFVCDLIRSAKKQIILFDNYIDDSVLKMLDKHSDGVDVSILTKSVSPQLQLDIEKHNSQYSPIKLQVFTNSHDRFLCIDETVYHIGASLKDLGKKWFAFNKMEIDTESLMKKL
ncbi:virulence RhuM family protein [bacterium]|nr:virulence RhuM family protein [bacterium]